MGQKFWCSLAGWLRPDQGRPEVCCSQGVCESGSQLPEACLGLDVPFLEPPGCQPEASVHFHMGLSLAAGFPPLYEREKDQNRSHRAFPDLGNDCPPFSCLLSVTQPNPPTVEGWSGRGPQEVWIILVQGSLQSCRWGSVHLIGVTRIVDTREEFLSRRAYEQINRTLCLPTCPYWHPNSCIR